MANIYDKIAEYKDNKVAQVWDNGHTVILSIYDNMEEFINLSMIDYRETGSFYSVKVEEPLVINKVLMTSKEFKRLSENYYRRTKARAYKAIYAEIIVAKALHGKHNNPYAVHGMGDVVANGIRYEVKYGKEITL